MRIKRSPQRNEEQLLGYQFGGEVVTVTLGPAPGKTGPTLVEEFDLTGIPEHQENQEVILEAEVLPFTPILDPIRVGGVLRFRYLWFYQDLHDPLAWDDQWEEV